LDNVKGISLNRAIKNLTIPFRTSGLKAEIALKKFKFLIFSFLLT